MSPKVGKLKPVDLREVWEHEASDFTQWLAQNLEYLSDALDMGLETLETEKKIDGSRFRIDILAEDEDGDAVIIENQLEKSDHHHLGQIITYATNLEAKTVIWINKEPQQEHINAVNWLNEFSDKDFYLIQIEAFQIDDSDPAPFFSIICKPSFESKTIGETKKLFQSDKLVRRARRANADTIIVPAQKEGFDKVFLGEHKWYSIRIKSSRIPQIKYIAGYQIDPVRAITHLATVKEIIPSPKDPKKWSVIFESPAKPITAVPLGKKSRIQGPAYCELSKLKVAKSVDDLLNFSEPSEKKKAA